MITLQRIASHQASVGIIGLGYVGLPLATEFAAKGFPTLGFDIDEAKVRRLKERKSYIKHIGDEKIAALMDRGFQPTTDFSRLASCDAVIICVPTPLDKNREPDLSFVVNSAEQIRKYIQAGQLVVLESTTYPGTTDEVIKPILESGGLKVGKDIFLAFSPEREDPNNEKYSTATIPKVVGGVSEQCLALASALYDQIIVKVVPVSSPATAEAVKILENTYRSVNIALVNELKMVFSAMGIDIWEVIEAASTKPFGFTPFYPGPGLGGHCIPVDPFYLSWKAREYEVPTKFIELAGEINTAMPFYVQRRVVESLNSVEKSVKGTSILLLGVAYKKNVDDLRESPALKIIELLVGMGAKVSFHDPYIADLAPSHCCPEGLRSVPCTPAELAGYDLVVITTDHSSIDFAMVAKHAKLIVDTRNATKNLRKNMPHIHCA